MKAGGSNKFIINIFHTHNRRGQVSPSFIMFKRRAIVLQILALCKKIYFLPAVLNSE
jgi:hypothetical protein